MLVVNDDDSYHHFALSTTSNFQIFDILNKNCFISGVFVAAALHWTSPDCDRCPVVSLYT
jgi:hypothetical protein